MKNSLYFHSYSKHVVLPNSSFAIQDFALIYDNSFILWTINLLSAERKRELSLLVRTSSNFCTCLKIWKSINSSPPLREGLTVQWVLGQLCIDIFSRTKVLIGEGTRLRVRAKVREWNQRFPPKLLQKITTDRWKMTTKR